jgi:hypothetical protein
MVLVQRHFDFNPLRLLTNSCVNQDTDLCHLLTVKTLVFCAVQTLRFNYVNRFSVTFCHYNAPEARRNTVKISPLIALHLHISVYLAVNTVWQKPFGLMACFRGVKKLTRFLLQDTVNEMVCLYRLSVPCIDIILVDQGWYNAARDPNAARI